MISPNPAPNVPTTTAGTERYTIQGGEEGKRRLNVLAEAMHPYTSALLDMVAVRAGARCLDIGCGGGYIALELYRETVRRRGSNADVGPLLPAFLRKAGLRNVGVRVVPPVALDGEGKRVSHLMLERIVPAVVAKGVATEAELAEVSAGLLAFTDDATTLISFPRIVQTWGRAA